MGWGIGRMARKPACSAQSSTAGRVTAFLKSWMHHRRNNVVM
jgi:hypothetical protein